MMITTIVRYLTARRYFSVLVFAVVLQFTHVSSAVAGKQITVMDHGLNMPIATYTIPNGWKIVDDIAMDPNTGRYARYRMDKYGPEGEIVRNLPPVDYGLLQGVSFQQAWKNMSRQGLHDLLQDVSIGQLRTAGPDITKARNNPQVQKLIRQMGINDLDIGIVDISGSRNGKHYTGRVEVISMPFPEDRQSGVMYIGILLSPPGLLDKTTETDMKISASAKNNPQYGQAIQQISQRVMQGMQQRHNQRMQASQHQFNAHQQIMQDRYQNSYQQNQQWMNDYRNQGPLDSGNHGYSSHDAYIDSINETSTFHDPDSGQNVTRDGQYDYNYTDGMGSYYGTDDPGFNPNAMPGDWQETEPLHPNY